MMGSPNTLDGFSLFFPSHNVIFINYVSEQMFQYQNQLSENEENFERLIEEAKLTNKERCSLC